VRPEMGERYNEQFKRYRDVMGLLRSAQLSNHVRQRVMPGDRGHRSTKVVFRPAAGFFNHGEDGRWPARQSPIDRDRKGAPLGRTAVTGSLDNELISK
jgi:hypothetical protein